MIELLKWRKPLVIVAQENLALFKEVFPELEISGIQLPKSKTGLILKKALIKKEVSKIVRTQVQSSQLYFPAFHPWNLTLLNWAKRKNILSLLTIHDYKTHIGERSRLIEILQKRMIRLADKVIFLTEYVRRQAEEEMGKLAKFSIVPHPILTAGVTNTLKHSSRPKLLFLGRGITYKGLDLLLNVIADLEKEQLTIAGDLRGFKSSHSRVRIIDQELTSKEIQELLASHHIMLLPYTGASQSGILTLGISAEMVMVITKVGGLPEQLPEDAASWCKPNEKSLREAIQELIDSSQKYSSLKSNMIEFKNQVSTLQQL